MSGRRRWIVAAVGLIVVVVLVLVLARACRSDDDKPSGEIDAAAVVGYWQGDWGRLVLQKTDDGEIRGVYDHDRGTVVGRIESSQFRGWWCEAPSRLPTADAGLVEFDFEQAPDGLSFDGRWKYGTDEAWREDWDLREVHEAPPQELTDRFSDEASFCPRPTG